MLRLEWCLYAVNLVDQRKGGQLNGPEKPNSVTINLANGGVFVWKWPVDTLIDDAEEELPVLIGKETARFGLNHQTDPLLCTVGQPATVTGSVIRCTRAECS
jgi:hypothetical protein